MKIAAILFALFIVFPIVWYTATDLLLAAFDKDSNEVLFVRLYNIFSDKKASTPSSSDSSASDSDSTTDASKKNFMDKPKNRAGLAVGIGAGIALVVVVLTLLVSRCGSCPTIVKKASSLPTGTDGERVLVINTGGKQ